MCQSIWVVFLDGKTNPSFTCSGVWHIGKCGIALAAVFMFVNMHKIMEFMKNQQYFDERKWNYTTEHELQVEIPRGNGLKECSTMLVKFALLSSFLCCNVCGRKYKLISIIFHNINHFISSYLVHKHLFHKRKTTVCEPDCTDTIIFSMIQAKDSMWWDKTASSTTWIHFQLSILLNGGHEHQILVTWILGEATQRILHSLESTKVMKWHCVLRHNCSFSLILERD